MTIGTYLNIKCLVSYINIPGIACYERLYYSLQRKLPEKGGGILLISYLRPPIFAVPGTLKY